MAALPRIGDRYPERAKRGIVRAISSSWRASTSTVDATTSVVRDFVRPRTPAEALMASHARTFSFAARFLPEPQRSETINLYAFFRTLDDLVDESPLNAQTRIVIQHELDSWERWIARGFAGDSPRPFIAEPVHGVVERRSIPRGYFLEFIAGLKSDLESVDPADREEVEHYSYQVASTVGLSLAHVFGATSAPARRAAMHMGIAMQLTNILRDVGGDLARGRFYLPATELDAHGLSRGDIERMWIEATGPDDRLKSLIQEIIRWADDHYAKGDAGISLLPAEVRTPVAISSNLYRQILRRLEQNDYDSLRTRASTTTWQKLTEAYRCVLYPGYSVSRSISDTRRSDWGQQDFGE